MARKINKFKSLIVPGVLGIGGFLGMVGPTHANTLGPITTTTPIPASTLTDWSGNLTFPKFNPALGNLTSVDVTFSSSLTTTLTVTNSGGTASSGNAKTELQLSITDAAGVIDPGETFLGNASGFSNPELDYTSAKFTYSGLPAGNSTGSGLLTGNASYDTGSLTASSLLSEFSGTGTILLPAATFTQTNISNSGGNTNATQTTDGGLTGTVTYTYTPVPEPTTMTLLVIGGTTALLQRRKRVLSA